MEKINIHEYIKNLSTEDIKRAINAYIFWYKNSAKWNDTESEIHKIYDLYFKPVGVNEINGILSSYHCITSELAKRWINGNI